MENAPRDNIFETQAKLIEFKEKLLDEIEIGKNPDAYHFLAPWIDLFDQIVSHKIKNIELEQIKDVCLICREEIKNGDCVTKSKCACKNIYYHNECIDNALQRKSDSPICRQSNPKLTLFKVKQ